MPEEKITAIIPLREYEEGKYLFMATEKGLVKKTPIQDYANVRKTGLAAIALREDDKLIEVKITDNDRGYSARYKIRSCVSVSMRQMYVLQAEFLWAYAV